MIREFCNDDYSKVILIGKLIDNDYKLMFNNASKCFVCVKNNEVIGFVIINILIDEIEITDIAVSKQYQRLGIASKLLDFIFDYTKNLNIKNIVLECRNHVVPFYEKNGFIIYNVRKNYYSNPTEDAILMIKEMK